MLPGVGAEQRGERRGVPGRGRGDESVEDLANVGVRASGGRVEQDGAALSREQGREGIEDPVQHREIGGRERVEETFALRLDQGPELQKQRPA